MSKVIFYNSFDCWKYFISSYFAAFKFLSMKNGPINVLFNIPPRRTTFEGIACEHPMRIVVKSESAIMSIDRIIQFKSWFIEKTIEKKVGVIVSTFHHEFAKFHTTIEIIFVQLLYQINFIRMKLDCFQNSLPCD